MDQHSRKWRRLRRCFSQCRKQESAVTLPRTRRTRNPTCASPCSSETKTPLAAEGAHRLCKKSTSLRSRQASPKRELRLGEPAEGCLAEAAKQRRRMIVTTERHCDSSLTTYRDRPLRAKKWRSPSVWRCDLPQIAPCIPHHSAPVPIGQVEWFFNRCCTCVERASIGRVDVVDVDIQKRRHRFAGTRIADHDHRVADSNLRGAIALDVTSGVERPLQELDQITGTLNNDSRRNRMQAPWIRRDRHGFLHRERCCCVRAQGCLVEVCRTRRSGSWKNRTRRRRQMPRCRGSRRL